MENSLPRSFVSTQGACLQTPRCRILRRRSRALFGQTALFVRLYVVRTALLRGLYLGVQEGDQDPQRTLVCRIGIWHIISSVERQANDAKRRKNMRIKYGRSHERAAERRCVYSCFLLSLSDDRTRRSNSIARSIFKRTILPCARYLQAYSCFIPIFNIMRIISGVASRLPYFSLLAYSHVYRSLTRSLSHHDPSSLTEQPLIVASLSLHSFIFPMENDERASSRSPGYYISVHGIPAAGRFHHQRSGGNPLP